jgi:hypothetical protein
MVDLSLSIPLYLSPSLSSDFCAISVLPIVASENIMYEKMADFASHNITMLCPSLLGSLKRQADEMPVTICI